jgi:hypothetical protein
VGDQAGPIAEGEYRGGGWLCQERTDP